MTLFPNEQRGKLPSEVLRNDALDILSRPNNVPVQLMGDSYCSTRFRTLWETLEINDSDFPFLHPHEVAL